MVAIAQTQSLRLWYGDEHTPMAGHMRAIWIEPCLRPGQLVAFCTAIMNTHDDPGDRANEFYRSSGT
jgi:hypothetical protein